MISKILSASTGHVLGTMHKNRGDPSSLQDKNFYSFLNKIMEQRILLLLASSIVLAGGPSKTCVSPLEEKPVHKRENEMSTLQINSYPSSSSSSELCLKTTGDFSQLATCPTGTGTDSFHFTIGSFAKGQYFIKSVVNGKCKISLD